MKLPVFFGEIHRLIMGKSNISFKLIEEQAALLINPDFRTVNKKQFKWKGFI
jgi:hypothetical protein